MISALVDKDNLIEAATAVYFFVEQAIFFSLLPGNLVGNSFAFVKEQLTAFVADWCFSSKRDNQKIIHNVKIKYDTELPNKPALRW